MEELSNSKVDVKLFRRFPGEGEKEVDYGPGYLKLYSRSRPKKQVVDDDADDDDDGNDGEIQKGVQIVFRSHGTMKVRANHTLWENDEPAASVFDTSFENELRYIALEDMADMAPGSSGVYGKERVRQPLDFPLAFEFTSEDQRDAFAARLQSELSLDGTTGKVADEHGREATDKNEIKEKQN